MSWIPFVDLIDSLNATYLYLTTGLINDIMNLLTGIVVMSIFPFVMVFSILYQDISYLYSVLVVPVNILLGIPSFANDIIGSWIPTHTPSAWVSLLGTCILMNMSVKIARVAKWVWACYKQFFP